MIKVIAVAPAVFIEKNLANDVYNIVNPWEPVPYLQYLWKFFQPSFWKKDSYQIDIADPHDYDYGWRNLHDEFMPMPLPDITQHGFQDPTHQERVRAHTGLIRDAIGREV